MDFAPGDRVTVTMPRSPSREGEYVEDRGSKCRVLLDGDKKARVVLTARVKPVKVRAWVSERVASGVMLHDATLVEIPPHLEVTGIDHATRTISVGLRAVPKPPKPYRSSAYMAFVRDFDCCWCGQATAIEAHHHGPHAMGQKTDDTRCIPVCRECHRHFHAHGSFHPEWRSGAEEGDTDIVARAAQVECLRAWCAYMKTDADAVIVTALINHIRESQT